jgi:hypothetical protein
VYVDQFCLENSASNGHPSEGMGQTSSNSGSRDGGDRRTGEDRSHQSARGADRHGDGTINLSAGPVKVWTAATPTVNR